MRKKYSNEPAVLGSIKTMKTDSNFGTKERTATVTFFAAERCHFVKAIFSNQRMRRGGKKERKRIKSLVVDSGTDGLSVPCSLCFDDPLR